MTRRLSVVNEISQRQQTGPKILPEATTHYSRTGSLLHRLDILVLLTAENLGSRYGLSRFGNLVAVLEPIGVALLLTVSVALTNTLAPPFGDSFILFFTTAVVPFYTFLHVAWRIRLWDSMPRLPGTSSVQMILAHSLGELVIKSAVLIVMLVLAFTVGSTQVIPYDILTLFAALLLVIAFGVGVGFISAVIGSFIPAWHYIFFILARAWLVLSGGLLIVDRAPIAFRSVASWVPLTHSIIMFRTGQYRDFPHLVLDIPYVISCSVGTLAFSLLLERATREWRTTR